MNKIKLAIIFTVFIDVIGVGVVIPVLPFYVESFGARPLIVTMLFAAFAVFSFISGPFLGALSDRIGRRPVLIMSILSTSIGWFVFAAAPNILFLFIGRIIDGMAAGNITTAQSYLVDISKDEKERTHNLGLIGAAFGVGFIIGPFLGGILSSVSHTFPFYFVGALAMLNVIMAYFMLPETNNNRDHNKPIEYNPFLPLKRAIDNEKLRPNFVVWFLFMSALSTMFSIYALYVGDVFKFNAFKAGMLFALSGLIVILNQAILLKRFWLKYFSVTTLEFWPLLLLAIGFFFFSLKILLIFIIGQIILDFSQSLLRVVMTSQVVGNVDANNKGEALGILNSLMSLSMVIAPMIAGPLYEKKPNAPFILSIIISLAAFAVVYLVRQKLEKLKGIEEEITSV